MAMPPEELERTEQIREYDRSRRWVIARIIGVVAGLVLVALLFTRKAEEYFFSATGQVHDSFVWGFWTPIAGLLLVIGLYLLLWYTPWFRAVRIKRRQAKQRTKDRQPTS